MAVLRIRILPDPALRRKAKRVRNIDGSVQKLIDDMIETMQAAPGVGLAAPQVGVQLRVIVFGLPGEEVVALLNPEVVKRSGERLVEEGCLSIPGYEGEIKRSLSVTVKGRDRQGRQVRIRARDLLAEVLDHEIDHINGVLYIDHLESRDKLREIEPDQDTEATAI
jgi:peptide deformylase